VPGWHLKSPLETLMRNRSMKPPCRRQRGAAALAVVLILVGAASLATAWMGRTLWTEQLGLSAQVRGVVAQETAQFGLDRAWAVLHEPRALDPTCQASPVMPGGLPPPDALRRLLESGSGPSMPLVACARVGTVWSCQCPAGPIAGVGAGTAPSPPWTAAGDREAFVVEATAVPGAVPGVRLVATACAEGGIACASQASAGSSPPGAVARLVADHALRAALAATPAAAVVAGGSIHLGDGPTHRVRVVNTDPDGHGLVLHAGGALHAGDATVTGWPGAPIGAALAPNDAALARGDAGQRLGAWLGSGPARWRDWPRVARLACDAAACDGADVDALLEQGHRAIAVTGSLRWTPGAAVRPAFILLVEGVLDLEGPGVLDAVLVAHELRLRNASSVPLEVRGGLIAAGDVSVEGTVTVRRDAAVLSAAGGVPLAVGRVSGQWRAVPLP
jgi:hypothetical protein